MKLAQLSVATLGLLVHSALLASALPPINIGNAAHRMGMWHPIRHLDLVDTIAVAGLRAFKGRSAAYKYVSKAHDRNAQESAKMASMYKDNGYIKQANAARKSYAKHSKFRDEFNDKAQFWQ